MANILRLCARVNSLTAVQRLVCAETMSSYSSDDMRPVYQWQEEIVEELEGYSPRRLPSSPARG